jgi:peptidoglycan-associated lipoprotein
VPERISRHPRELISSRIDGEIEPSEAKFLRAHVDVCAWCQRKDAELKAVAEGLARLRVPDPPAEAIERLLERLRGDGAEAAASPTVAARAAAGEPRQALPWRRAPKWLLVGAASAAAVAAVVHIGVRGDRTGASGAGRPAPFATSRPAEPAAVPHAPVPAFDAATPGSVDLAVEEVRSDAEQAPVAASTVEHSPLPRPSTPVPTQGPVAGAQEPIASLRTPAGAATASEPPAAAPREIPTFRPVRFKRKGERLSREAQQLVESVAGFLRQHPDVRLVIESHADERDSIEKNRALAAERAATVARHLESLGIASSRMRTVSHGEPPPPEGSERDRGAREETNRVEFVLAR